MTIEPLYCIIASLYIYFLNVLYIFCTWFSLRYDAAYHFLIFHLNEGKIDTFSKYFWCQFFISQAIIHFELINYILLEIIISDIYKSNALIHYPLQIDHLQTNFCSNSSFPNYFFLFFIDCSVLAHILFLYLCSAPKRSMFPSARTLRISEM